MDAGTILRKTLERIGGAILNMSVMLTWLAGGSAVGYTLEPDAKKRIAKICVALESELYKGLSTAEKKVLVTGIFAHELCHQIQTNFKYGLKVTNEIKCCCGARTAALFHMVQNVLEDPAIEFHAPLYFGGALLEALQYSIAYFWNQADGIDKSESAWAQYVNAYIEVGDLGKIKGSFTFPEAEKAFNDSYDLFMDGVHCADAKKRVDIAQKIFFLPSVKALWEEEIKNEEAMEKAMKKLLEDIANNPDGEPSGTPMEMPEDLPDEIKKSLTGRAEANREETKKEIEKKKTEEAEKVAEEADGSEDGASTEDRADKAGSEGEGKSEGTEAGNEDGKSTSSGKSEDKADGSDSRSGSGAGKPNHAAENSDSSKGDKSDGGAENSSGRGGSCEDGSSNTDSGKSDSDGADGEEQKSDDSDLEDEMKKALENASESLSQEMDKEQKRAEKEEAENALPDAPDTHVDDADLRGATTKDVRADQKWACSEDGRTYPELKAEYMMTIHSLEKTLEKIFREDQGGKMWATSGRYDITRGYIGTTARMFQKETLPSDKFDAAVLLLIDCSGSMCNPRYDSVSDCYVKPYRYQSARKAAIVMGEALKKMHVPFSVVGFTADNGTDNEMIHFVSWSDKTSEMNNLALIQPYGDNFDGYAIRSAMKMLSGRRERHKYLFVISDGQPAAYFYDRHHVTGHEDTKKALQQAEKAGCRTFGIGIGEDIDEEEFHDQYHGRFIHVEDSEDLTYQLSRKLAKVFKA